MELEALFLGGAVLGLELMASCFALVIFQIRSRVFALVGLDYDCPT
jgi:hypothetical protein